MIKAVIFDCFGVLTTDLWKEFVATLPDNQKQQAHDMNHAYDAGLMTKVAFMQGLEKLTGKTSAQIEAVRNSDGVKNQELLDYIRKLKQTYKIGLLSNVATNWIRDVLLTPQEQGLFDDMILSFEVGLTKPDPKMFELACQRLDVEPQDTVMIDDVQHYCEAARSMGMQAIAYQNFAQLQADLEKILERA